MGAALSHAVSSGAATPRLIPGYRVMVLDEPAPPTSVLIQDLREHGIDLAADRGGRLVVAGPLQQLQPIVVELLKAKREQLSRALREEPEVDRRFVELYGRLRMPWGLRS
jgi:hypothetical protein